VLSCETRSCHACRHNDLEGHRNYVLVLVFFGLVYITAFGLEAMNGVQNAKVGTACRKDNDQQNLPRNDNNIRQRV